MMQNSTFISKLKHLVLLAFIVSSVGLKSQINVQWESRFDNALGLDKAIDMVIDASGNVYVTGDSFDGTSFNIVTIKYNNAGTQLWMAEFDGASNGVDQASSIDIDASGNVFITGYTYTGVASDYDIVTVKYNGTTGIEDWSVINPGTANFDSSKDLVVDDNGDVYVVGQIENGANINMTILKYANATGAVLWTNNYTSAGNNFDSPTSVVVDENNNVYMAGYSENGADETDFLVRKYNSAGAIQWTQRYDNSNGPDEPRAAVFDNRFNQLILSGSSFSTTLEKLDFWTISIDPITGALNWDQVHNGTGSDDDVVSAVTVDTVGNVYVTGKSKGVGTNFDYLTIRYDNAGNQIWLERFVVPGNGLDIPSDIFASEDGNLFVTGYSYSATTNNDFLTIKYDTLGNVLWSTRFDGPASNVDNALRMDVDPNGNIYVTGNSKGTSTNWDYSTIKYCQHTTFAGTDTSLCLNESIVMNATSPGGSNFTWDVVSGDPISVGSNFSCNPCNNPTISPAVTTVYTVSSENSSGCVDFDTIEVVVNPLPGPAIYASGPTSFCDGDSVRIWTDSTSGYLWSDGTSTIGVDSTILVTQDGTYSVTVEDQIGCQNTSSQVVTVFTLPTLTFSTTTPFCDGDSTQLEVMGAVDYEWYNDPTLSDPTISTPYASPDVTTVYEVIGTDANGCKDTATVTATVFQLPSKPIIVRPGCDTLVSSYNNGNQWFMNGFSLPNANDSELRIFYDGDYYIHYTDNNGCTVWSDTIVVRELDTCIIDTSLNSSITEITDQNIDFKLYPNPANSIVTIEFSNAMDALISLLGINGQLIEERKVNSSSIEKIEVSSLPKGLYLIRIQAENSVKVKKLIIQ